MSEHTATTVAAGRRRRHPALDRRRAGSLGADVHRRLAHRRAAARPRSPAAARPRWQPRPWPPRRPRSPAGRPPPARTAPTHPARDRRRGREAGRRARPGRDRRQRRAAALAPARRDAPGRAQLPLLRRLAAASWTHEDFEIRGHTGPRVSWDPAGPVRADHAVERPADAGHLAVAPALAAGQHGGRSSPPEWAPLTASLLADIAAEAGLPAGVFNVVQGYGAEAGDAAGRAPGRAPDQLHRLGRRRPSASPRPPAATSRRCRLELGGKSPLLVFADADLDLAVDLAVEQYDNAGQVCLAAHPAPGRGVGRRRSSPRRFVERAAALAQGDPRDEATDIGPEHPPAPPGEGGRLRAAGASRPAPGRCSAAGQPELGGLYYQPTLLADAAPGLARSSPRRCSARC